MAKQKCKVDVKIYNIKQTKKVKETGLLANVQLTIDDMFAVTNIKVCKTIKGKRKGTLYIQFPSAYNKKNEEYYNIFFPVTKEAREALVNKILEEYKSNLDEEEDKDEDEDEDIEL